MSQNILGLAVQIDSKFAQMVRRIMQNKYNPIQLYNPPLRGTKEDPSAIPLQPNSENIKKRDDFDKRLIRRLPQANAGVTGSSSLPSKNRFDRNNTADSVSLYAGYDLRNYTRYISKDVLNKIYGIVDRSYLTTLIRKQTNLQKTNNTSRYDSDPNHSPYRPVPLPMSPSQLINFMSQVSKATQGTGALNKILGTLGGLGQYYFGGSYRAFKYMNGWRLGQFIAYNTFRGLFLNMTPTPMSFALGFDIPLIGPLAINVIGGFGKGGFKSQYSDEPTPPTIRDHHTFTAPFGGIGRSSANRTLQGKILDQKVDDFYKQVSLAREDGTVDAPPSKDHPLPWKKRQDAWTSAKARLTPRILKKFFRNKAKRPGRTDTPRNVYKSFSKTGTKDSRYQVDKQDVMTFHKMLNPGFNSQVIMIKIKHQQTLNGISDMPQLQVPRVIKSMSDGVAASWQDAWTNTGRFQPVKVYLSSMRNMQLTFSVFAYTLFNEPAIYNYTRDKTEMFVNGYQFNGVIGQDTEHPNRLLPNRSTTASPDRVPDMIRRGDVQYRKNINWLMQLRYPKFTDGSIKRYNNRTYITIGQYASQAPIIVNNVSVNPSFQFYWANSFPMMIDVSLSMNVYKPTYENGKISKLSVIPSKRQYKFPFDDAGSPSKIKRS